MRHLGHYEAGKDAEAGSKGGWKGIKAGMKRRGSVSGDASSVGMQVAASGGTPAQAGEEARRIALAGGASEVDAEKAAGLAAGAAVMASGGSAEEASKAAGKAAKAAGANADEAAEIAGEAAGCEDDIGRRWQSGCAVRGEGRTSGL